MRVPDRFADEPRGAADLGPRRHRAGPDPPQAPQEISRDSAKRLQLLRRRPGVRALGGRIARFERGAALHLRRSAKRAHSEAKARAAGRLCKESWVQGDYRGTAGSLAHPTRMSMRASAALMASHVSGQAGRSREGPHAKRTCYFNHQSSAARAVSDRIHRHAASWPWHACGDSPGTRPHSAHGAFFHGHAASFRMMPSSSFGSAGHALATPETHEPAQRLRTRSRKQSQGAVRPGGPRRHCSRDGTARRHTPTARRPVCSPRALG